MSQRLLVADLRNDSKYRVATVLGVCPTDDRILAWANAAQEALLNQGRFWGSVTEAQFCVTNGCLVWPREVATIEQVAVCGQPVSYTNGWYPYTRLLANLQQCRQCGHDTGSARGGCSCGFLQMREKPGFAVSYASVLGSNKVIRTYVMDPSDEGKTLIFQGYDEDGTWVRTQVDGEWIDGEQVTLPNPAVIAYVDTVTVWKAGAPTGVIKDPTNQRVLVYSFDTTTSTERALAVYQPSETRPMYRQSFLPSFDQIKCCGCSEDDENLRTVTALVSLQHVPLESDNDFLIFQNVGAFKMAMQAAKLWEDPGTYALGNLYFYGTQAGSRNARGVERVVNRGAAIPLLVAELRKMTGDRTNAYVYCDETNRPVNDMIGFR